MIDLRLARGSTTGALLRDLLIERHVQIGRPGNAIVSYGCRVESPTLPCLNANAGRWNKFEELGRIRDAGILVPYHNLDGSGLQFPILGRKFRHSKGRDIIPILQNDQEFTWRKQGGHSDFFTQYIPRKAEYRVWMYRGRKLAAYEKVMKYPERYERIGCNFQNGFAFEFIREPEQAMLDMSAASVAAMQLDFGAVDILRGMDDKLWVLEVNTAPGQEGIRQALTSLTDRIVKWEALGYPQRRGAE